MRTHTTLVLATALAFGCDGPAYSNEGARAADETFEPAPISPGDAGTADPGMDPTGSDIDGDGYADLPTGDEELAPEWIEMLDARRVDYSAALRTASLRLRGDLPTLLEIRFVAEASNPEGAYESLVEGMLEDPRLVRQLRHYFRDTFKMGGNADLDTAPLFAVQLAIEDRSMNELFTATAGACPTWDDAAGAIAPGDCMNGAPAPAGILSNPHVMKHFFSNLAFRRVRWLQETFACAPFPAEFGEPIDVGGANPYTAPWPFESIAGADTGGRVNFHDVSSVTCANCHATINHLAPLFARFDADGMWQDAFAVPLPVDGAPMVEMGDYLPPGEPTAWRIGVPAPDLPSLGSALANDPNVARCTVARAWSWALGKGDMVATLSPVPASVTSDLQAEYVGGGHRFRELLYTIFTSDDFVRF